MTPWFATTPFFHLLNFNHSETDYMMRFEKDTRYYAMSIEKDLLDDWIIIVVNGRSQTKLGQIRTLAFARYSDAFDHFCGMIQVRLKRHYQLKFYQSGNSLLRLLAYAPITKIDDQTPNRIPKVKKARSTKDRSKKNNHPTPIQMGLSF